MVDPDTQSRQRHEQFLRESVAHGEVWVLAHADDPDSWATSELAIIGPDGVSVDRPVVPVWSDGAAAQACARGPWADYAPQHLSLDDFLEQALQGLHEQGVLVGTNWDANLVGRDSEAADLARELSGMLLSLGR